MKIQEMLQREPFGQIIEKTFSRYLTAIYGQEYQVHWFDRISGDFPAREQIWLCRPDLSAIFYVHAHPDVYLPIRNEFLYTPILWRRPFQRIYIECVTHPLVMQRLARMGFGVYPHWSGAEKTLIWGANRRMRIFDLEAGTVRVLLKDGFPIEAMQRELEVRTQAQGWQIPPVTAIAEDFSWFEERTMQGTPFNRLPPGVNTAPYIEKAHQIIWAWLGQTCHQVNTMDYVAGLADRINMYVRSNFLLGHDLGEHIRAMTRTATKQIERLVSTTGANLDLATGHGDFQPGNLFIEDSQLWVLDWEHSAERQFLYDPLVFAFSRPFTRGLAKRLNKALYAGVETPADSCLYYWHEFTRVDTKNRTLILVVFMLEELAWHLHENHNPLFKQIGSGLQILLPEVSEFLQQMDSIV